VETLPDESLKDANQKFHEGDKSKRDPGERSLAFRQLLNQFIAVCKTIAYAHSRGIIHRDIKPGNILLGKFGETLVVDWGIARPFGRTEAERSTGEETLMPPQEEGKGNTRMGLAIGTPEYMSPEQAAGRLDVMGPASDIYSLGATLYTLLTRKPSITGANDAEKLQKVQQGDFQRPSELHSHIPKELEAICLKAMALKQKDRHATALELAEDVEHWLADEPVAAYREPWLARIRRFTRRNRTLVASVAVALLATVLLGGGGSGWWWWQHELDQRLMRQDVEPLLSDIEEILRHPDKNPREAQHLLDQAHARLPGGGLAELRTRVVTLQRDVGMATRLEDARLRADAVADGKQDYRGADRLYAAAFREYGLEPDSDNPDAAETVRASAISEWLIVALDHWSFVKNHIDEKSGSELSALADRADHDAWRHQLRAALHSADPKALALLAGQESLKQPPANLGLLAGALYSSGSLMPAEEFLYSAVERYPGDFLLNLRLSETLLKKQPPDVERALIYAQAARALRPESSLAVGTRGICWSFKKEYDKAMQDYDEAISLNPKDAISLYNRGNAWRDMKEFDKAIQDYDEAIRFEPKDSHAFANRGFAWFNKKEYDRALKDFDQAIRLNPEAALAYFGRGDVLFKEKEYEKAIKEYDAAISLDLKYAPFFNNRGIAWFEKKDYDRAIKDYDEAIRLDPKFASAFNNRGNVWRFRNDFDKAIRDYDEAIRFEPKDYHAFTNRGSAWLEKKDYDKAIKDCDEAIRLEPKYAPAFTSRGNCWAKKMEYDKAIKDFDEAIRLDPKDARAFSNRGLAWFYKNEFDQAMRDLEEAFRLNPKYAPAFNNRGLVWYAKKDYDRAMKDYDEAIRLDPNNASAFNNRGNVWRFKNEFDKAIRDFDEAIRLDPMDARTLCNRGIAWFLKKEYDTAIKDFDEAIRIDRKLAGAFYERGIAWFEKKEYDKAIKDYDEAIRIDGKYAGAFYERGSAWSAKQEYDKAIKDYDEVIRLGLKGPDAFYGRAIALSIKKEYDKAIKDYDEAIRLGLKNPMTFHNRGFAWFEKKEYDKAIKDFDEAIRLGLKHPVAFYNRGNAWREKKDYDKAIKDYDEAIRLQPKYAEAHFDRSVVRMLIRRPESAGGFQTVLDLEGWRGNHSPYAVILGHLAAWQLGDEMAAKRFLKESDGELDEATWPYPVVKFLRGEIDEPALLKVASDDNKRTEARCYLGLDHALNRRKDEAITHLRWVKEHGDSTTIIYKIAVAELERLEGSRENSKP
jgi:tetratricopeptide (TPR) repeat protein